MNRAVQLEQELEKAQDESYAKSLFLAKMSHEMRTPLNAIIGLSELILGAGGINEEAYENLEKIYNAGITLLSTVNDILDISKIEAGKFEITAIEYDVPNLINNTIAQSIMYRGEKPIEFILNIEENFPSRLYGDELRVKQIFNNLLSNAFKYTKQGKVELDIRCMREIPGQSQSAEHSLAADETVWINISVRDTGIGIRQKDTANLFGDYVKVDTETNRLIEGTGLGLSIVKKLAELMNGTIAVESDYGKGSVFTVKIRQKTVAGGGVIGPDVKKNLENFRHSAGKYDPESILTRIDLPYARVLVVDDNITNLAVAKGLFKLYKMHIDCMTSGQQAIDAIREEKVRYNAIFMDHIMSGMDGIETTRIIRHEIGTEYAKTVPIIALTANAIVGNEKMFLDNGFQAFISKPIDAACLDAIVRRWVQNKQQEEWFVEQQGITNEQACDDMPKRNLQLWRKARVEQERRALSERQHGINLITMRKIPGLDIDRGISRFGDEESFLTILRSYAVNTYPILEKLKIVNQNNLADYAILIHGIKGSSRGIYADIVGTKAEALEKAAKAGDSDFVIANNSSFIDITEKLITDIENMLSKASGKSKSRKDKPDMRILSRILHGCLNYDINAIEAAMAEIEIYEYESDDGLVAWLKENVEQMNFKQIKERLAKLC